MESFWACTHARTDMEGYDILLDEVKDYGYLIFQPGPLPPHPVSEDPPIQFASLMQKLQTNISQPLTTPSRASVPFVEEILSGSRKGPLMGTGIVISSTSTLPKTITGVENTLRLLHCHCAKRKQRLATILRQTFMQT